VKIAKGENENNTRSVGVSMLGDVKSAPNKKRGWEIDRGEGRPVILRARRGGRYELAKVTTGRYLGENHTYSLEGKSPV